MTTDDTITLDRKVFRLASTSGAEHAEAGETVFHFRQHGRETFWATYRGGRVASGTLVGRFVAPRRITLHFQQITDAGEYRSGSAEADIEDAGRLLRLHERWRVEGGTGGNAVLEEVPVLLEDATCSMI